MSYEKGIYLKTVDYDRVFRSLSQPAIFANDFRIDSEEERQRLNSIIYTSYDGDTLSNVPQCDGGHLSGEYNLGLTCPICNTKVVSVTEKPLESLLWIDIPDPIPAFIHLNVWRILSNALTYSSFNILEYLTNPTYRPSVKSPPIMQKVKSLGLPIGLSKFYEHYDEIIISLYRNRIFRGPVAYREKLMRYLQEVRDITFTKRLPFPSKLAFITEENNSRMFADHRMRPAIDAVQMIASLNSEGEEFSLNTKESRAVRVITRLCAYYKDFETNIVFKKEGIMRKLIYGARPDWTYRAVISSNHGVHDYHCLELPWSLSVLLFQTHLSNKLLKRKFTPNEIKTLLYENTLRHHPILDGLFKELIEESKVDGNKGIPTTFARNPTLKRGSIERFFIDKIKEDPTVNTVSISVLALVAKNADFDGRALPSLNVLNCWKSLRAIVATTRCESMNVNA